MKMKMKRVLSLFLALAVIFTNIFANGLFATSTKAAETAGTGEMNILVFYGLFALAGAGLFFFRRKIR